MPHKPPSQQGNSTLNLQSNAHYFDPQTSTLSPYTLPNMGLFVYGTLPVYLVKNDRQLYA